MKTLRKWVAASALLTMVGTPLAAQWQWIPRSVLRESAARAVVKDTVHVVRANRTDTVAVTTAQGVPIKKGEVVVVETEPAAQPDSAATDPYPHMDQPGRYFVLGSAGGLLNLRLRVSVGRGLRYDRDAGAYVGEITVGLEDTVRLTEQVTLSTPIEIQVTGEADRLDPGNFEIGHTNLPYTRVTVRANAPRDTVYLVVQPTFNPTGERTPVPVERLPVQVRTSQPAIQGFGLQTATVTIRIPGAPAGIPLVVWSTRGRLEADTLTLAASGMAVTRVRSEGIGAATVHAELGQLASGLTPIRYTVPWTFLAAAVLGGLLGAVIRRHREETKRRASKADLPVGICFGLLGAVAFALGLNLFGLDISVRIGEAATFLAAAASAALDLPGLTGLRAKFATP